MSFLIFDLYSAFLSSQMTLERRNCLCCKGAKRTLQ